MIPESAIGPEGGGPALRVDAVSKSFAETKALNGVSFDVAAGQIHALLGGNGSGKSTLVKILAGVYTADDGDLEVQGVRLPAASMSPSEAERLGLRFVHQQPSVFPEMTVGENLCIGRSFPTGTARNIRWRQLRSRAREVLERFGIEAHPDQPLHTLGPAGQTMVEIARALQDQEGETQGILVLDEATASLPAPEVELLLAALRRYAAEGQTIIFVSHRLDEVMGVADRVTVLRDGNHIATRPVSELTHDQLVELIVGRFVGNVFPEAHPPAEHPVVLEAHGLAGGPVRGADFTLHAGEVLGVAGLVGSGRSSLLRIIFGDMRIESGTLELEGKPFAPRAPKQAMRAGVAYVPETRSDAAFPDMTLAENLSAASVKSYWHGGVLHHRREMADTRKLIDLFNVKTSSPLARFGNLSGGNQQKAILGRWLRREPKVLLLDEPTHGVDVGARVEIYATVRRAVDQGAAVLVVSSDFDELAGLCDHVLVMADGRFVADVRGKDLDSGRLQELAYARGGTA